MAHTTPWLYYQFFVYPNYSDFLAKPDDIRLGFNASVSAFQQADIFYAYYRRRDPKLIAAWPTKKAFLVDLGIREPFFRTVQSVATVYKHLYTSGGHYDTGSPMSLWGVGSKRGTNLEMKWGDGAREGHVIVRRRDGATCRLADALEAVVTNLWANFLPEDYDDI
jgi:hypothetical protein